MSLYPCSTNIEGQDKCRNVLYFIDFISKIIMFSTDFQIKKRKPLTIPEVCLGLTL